MAAQDLLVSSIHRQQERTVVSLNTRSCEEVLDIPDLDLHYRKRLIFIRALSMDEFQGQQEIVLKKHKHKSDFMPKAKSIDYRSSRNPLFLSISLPELAWKIM